MESEQSWKAVSPQEDQRWEGEGGDAERRGEGVPVRGQYQGETERPQFAQWPESELRGPGDGERWKAAVARLARWHSGGARCSGPSPCLPAPTLTSCVPGRKVLISLNLRSLLRILMVPISSCCCVH